MCVNSTQLSALTHTSFSLDFFARLTDYGLLQRGDGKNMFTDSGYIEFDQEADMSSSSDLARLRGQRVERASSIAEMGRRATVPGVTAPGAPAPTRGEK